MSAPLAVSPSSQAPAPPAPLSGRHFTSLDGYRGLAFLLVFVRHYGLTSHLTSPIFITLQYWGQGSWIGVDLFFALSGFLITGILLDTAGHPHFFRNFMARRALRIFPLYYGVALLLVLLTPVLHLQWQRGHLLYLVYLGNVAHCLSDTLNGVPPAISLLHMWSLSVEEQFYLLWPGVIYLIVRRGNRRGLLPLCLGLSAVSFVLRLWLVRIGAIEWAYAMLPTHMDGLLFGAIAALLLRTRPLETIRPVARWAFSGAAVVLALVILARGPNFYSPAMILFGFPAYAVLFSSILLLSLVPGSLTHRIGTLPLLRFFGRYSYGMYIFHLLFWPLSAHLLVGLQATLGSLLWGGLAYVASMLALTTAVSVLSYQLYEKRWLRLKSRFADRPASPAAAVAS